MQSNQSFSDIITAIRFPMIVLVVMVHILPEHLEPLPSTFSGRFFYIFITEYFSHLWGRMAVPTFFIISGYLLFIKMQQWSVNYYIRQLRKRVRTLLIPYILWNAVIVVIVFIKNIAVPQSNSAILNNLISNFSFDFWEGPINLPLWYLRDLMCMVLLSPILYLLIKITRGWLLLLLYVCYLFSINIPIPGFSSISFFYFSVGIYIAVYNIDMPHILNHIPRFPLWLLVISLSIMALFLNQTVYYNAITSLFVPLSVLAIMQQSLRLVNSVHFMTFSKQVSPMIFFIFVSHHFYIIERVKSFFLQFHFNVYGNLIAYFLTTVITILICILVYKLLQHLTPRILNILIGSRNRLV